MTFLSSRIYDISKELLHKIILDSMLDSLEQIKKRIANVVILIRKHINSKPEIKQTLTYLTSVPGIGFLTGATLMAELVDINRFKHLNHLASYVGLVPSVYCSGETQRNLGITNIYLHYLRNELIESAWMAIRTDPALLLCYCQLIKRMKKVEAIIRISKKLLNRIMMVWKNQTTYGCPAVM